jgi:curved DNA-binding protein CbpA
MKNYYQLLGVNENASKDQIKEAYKRLSIIVHPDKNNGDVYYSDLFKEINEANQVLSNDLKRAEYDESLKEELLLKQHFEKQLGKVKGGGRDLDKRRKKLTILLATVKFIIGIIVAGAITMVTIIAIDSAANLLPDQPPKHLVRIKLLNPYDSSNSSNSKNEASFESNGDMAELKTRKQIHRVIANNVSGSATPGAAKAAKVKIEIPIESKADIKSSTIAANLKEGKEDTVGWPKINRQTMLTESQMGGVWADLTSKREASKNKINCVKVLVTVNSNVVNGFEIAKFLQAKGLIISGREVIKDTVAGIRVEEENGCFVVTVGTI